jgi:hypothetical protein
MKRLLRSGAAALLLAACSPSPSDEEAAQAVPAPATPPPEAPPPEEPAPEEPTTGRWQSALFPFDDESGRHQRAKVSFAGRSSQLLDYSYAGYWLGASPLASGIRCHTVDADGSADITASLQAAVNSVGGSGGGTVAIPAGTFALRRSIEVPFDNVSIVGAGSGETILQVPADYAPRMDPDEGAFTFGKRLGGWNKAWVDRGPVVAEVSAPIAPGQAHVDVRDAGAVNVGDWIIVAQYHWPAYSQRHSGGQWPSYAGFPADPTKANREFSYAYLRRVAGKSGTRLMLDAPIPWALDPDDNPVRLRSPANSIAPLRANVGLAGVSIRFADNTSGAGDRPAGNGVYFEGVRDGWVHDVEIRNFPRNGIYMDHAARITVLDSTIAGAQDGGVGGYGYGIQVKSSQNVLLRRLQVTGTRHAFTSRGALTSMLVQTENVSAGNTLEDDVHFAMSQGVLFDYHAVSQGTGVLGTYRGAESGGAHESLGSAVYWNVRGDGAVPGHGALRLNPASTGAAIVVGPTAIRVIEVGRTLATAEPIVEAPGLQVADGRDAPGPGSRDGNVLYEGVGRAGIAPASLYAAQLDERLDDVPSGLAAPCG